MIWMLLPFGLVAILVAGILVSDYVACRLIYLSKGRLRREDLQEKCREGGESFAMLDEPRTMSLLSPGGAGTEKVTAPGDAQIVAMNRWNREHL